MTGQATGHWLCCENDFQLTQPKEKPQENCTERSDDDWWAWHCICHFSCFFFGEPSIAAPAGRARLLPIWQRSFRDSSIFRFNLKEEKKKTSLNTLSFATFFYLISGVAQPPTKKNQRTDQAVSKRRSKKKKIKQLFAKITNTRIFVSMSCLRAMRSDTHKKTRF